MRLVQFGVGLALVSCIGCASVKTTVLDRKPGGHLTKGSERPINGVPVMLRVPTHLDVTITQTEFWDPKSGKFQQVGAEMPSRHVETKIIETEKLFFLDPKRVASGTGIYGFSFDGGDADTPGNPGNGYLTGLTYEAVDTTVAQSASLITNIASTLGNLKSDEDEAQAMADNAKVIMTQRTIAFRKFDINSPSIEEDVRGFCAQYLNDCRPNCCSDPNYPAPQCPIQ